jgi:hypothetical protein
MQTSATIKELRDALEALVDAIDFEGGDGRVRFYPGMPCEREQLTTARAVLEKTPRSSR